MIRKSRLQYPPYRIAEDVGFYLCALDFSSFREREDIMTLVQAFDRRVKRRAWYESDLYAWLYRTARRAKHMLKR